MEFKFHDVNEAYCEMQTIKRQFAQWEDTRNGKAMVFMEPVLLTHLRPERRVLFDPIRNANPYFHYMEAIWMLAGSNSVRMPTKFARNLLQYSDDGFTFHGAYGHRWRYHFGFDQIAMIIGELEKNPSTRRLVLTMWDPEADLGEEGKDFPCNTHIYFRTRGEYLDMTVCNRSNDLAWGMLGANIVHFSILLEYIANSVGLRIGYLHQFSNNVHVYEDWVDKFDQVDDRWYNRGGYQAIAFSHETLDENEASDFCIDGLDREQDYLSPILVKNAIPMMMSWEAHKDSDYKTALRHANAIFDDDWREACSRWLRRRYEG